MESRAFARHPFLKVLYELMDRWRRCLNYRANTLMFHRWFIIPETRNLMNEFTVEIPREWASIEVIQRACYRLADVVDIDVRVSRDEYRLTLRIIKDRIDPENAGAELKRHILDYSLRERIGHQTEATRNLILASAFSRILQQVDEGDE